MDAKSTSEESRLTAVRQNARIPIIDSPPERNWIWSDLRAAAVASSTIVRLVCSNRLGGRMVVDAETPRDRGDATAAVEHRAADASDDLRERDHKQVGNPRARCTMKSTDGEPHSSRQRAPDASGHAWAETAPRARLPNCGTKRSAGAAPTPGHGQCRKKPDST